MHFSHFGGCEILPKHSSCRSNIKMDKSHVTSSNRGYLRHHCRAKEWTFVENNFLLKFNLKWIYEWKLCEKIQLRSWSKLPSKLLSCTGFLYIKLAVSLCSFSPFSFPFNFQTAEALVLKFGTLPLICVFSNTFSAIMISFFVQQLFTVLYQNGPKLKCGRVFKYNVISKANVKNPEHSF